MIFPKFILGMNQFSPATIITATWRWQGTLNESERSSQRTRGDKSADNHDDYHQGN